MNELMQQKPSHLTSFFVFALVVARFLLALNNM